MNRAQLAGGAGLFRTADAVLAAWLTPRDRLAVTIAEAHDPDADTRVIIHEIQQLNAMTSDQVRPGESLWVPRG